MNNSHSENAGKPLLIPGLNGLRGLACLGVFCANYLNKIIPEWDFFGVDIANISGRTGLVILFLLSGFALSLPFWRALKRNDELPGVGRFWLKRIARIAPAYFLCLTALVIHNQHWNEDLGWVDIILHYTFLYNFAEFSFYSINSVFWVLAHFAQFYLIIPLLFMFSRSGGVRSALTTIVVVFVASYLAHLAVMTYTSTLTPWPFNPEYIRANGAVLSRSLLAHMPLFLLGVITGYIYSSRHSSHPTTPHSNMGIRADFIILICVTLLIVILGSDIHHILQIPYGRYNFPLIPIIIAVIIYSTPKGYFSFRFLESAALKFLGAISYGIFVFHYPAINLTTRFLKHYGVDITNNWFLVALVILLVTMIIATFSYYLLERPVLRFVRGRNK
jgi:peptidoglycan/LPS O-acetylase OafA/YrhL